jgi:hypothetical protein
LGDINLKINYKYINEFNQITEMKISLDKYYNLLSTKFNILIELLKKDMEKNKELKKIIMQINSMIVQLNKEYDCLSK